MQTWDNRDTLIILKDGILTFSFLDMLNESSKYNFCNQTLKVREKTGELE